jgi:hypothetical protein
MDLINIIGVLKCRMHITALPMHLITWICQRKKNVIKRAVMCPFISLDGPLAIPSGPR